MNEYTSVGGVARSHSDNGNLKDNGSLTFVYDYKNRLIGAFDKATNNPVAAYLYYCDNRRAKKIVYSQTSPGVIERQERFFYDGNQVVEETDDAGNTLLTWVYSPVYVDEPVQYVRTSSHSLGAGTFHLHQNARADVVAVTDAAGAVAERRLYDDYGRSFDGTSKASVSGSAVGNVYGFQGRRLDAETGLYYYRARYYDPSTGRFVQRDPVWDPGNFGNQYSFVGNGPVSGVDPEGLDGGRGSQWRLEDANTPAWKKPFVWIGRALGEVFGNKPPVVAGTFDGGVGTGLKVAKAGGMAVKAAAAGAKTATAVKAAKLAKAKNAATPGTAAHRSARWGLYKLRVPPGKRWSYGRWLITYLQNVKRAKKAQRAEKRIQRQLKLPHFQASIEVLKGVWRRVDVADKAKRIGVEVKTGYACATLDNLSELERDAQLVEQGWRMAWHFTGTASLPLLKKLKNAGITITGRRIPKEYRASKKAIIPQ